MSQWLSRIKLKHLLTEKEDYESIKKSMNAIADVLENEIAFIEFKSYIKNFRNIPAGDKIVNYLDYARQVLDRMMGSLSIEDS